MIKKYSISDKDIKEIAKKSLHIIQRFKLRRIKDSEEKRNATIHLIYSRLHLKYLHLSHKLERSNIEKFYAEVNLRILSDKLRLFLADPTKESFYNIMTLINKIEKELKNGFT